MKTQFYLFCLFVFFISCSKNPDITDKNIFLSKKIYHVSGFSWAYNYDQGNRFESMDEANAAAYVYQKNIVKSRNSAGEITELHTVPTDPGSSTVKYVFHYNALGRRDSMKTYSWPGNVSGRIKVWEFPSGKLLEKEYNMNGQLDFYAEVILTDDGKNIKEIINYDGLGVPQSRTVYTSWDTKKNPETLVPLAFSLEFTSYNNPLTFYTFVYATSTTYQMNQTYIYNSEGYPLSSELTGANITTPQRYTYEYVYR